MADAAETHPLAVIIAGPNGAGKSTIAARLLRGALEVRHYVNADVIARGLSEFHSEDVAFEAGRIMLERLHKLAEAKESFAFETTLASRTYAPWLRTLITGGYSFHLVYLWLPKVEMAIRRVRKRVAAGGHGIPTEAVRNRYYRGIGNFFELYRPLAKNWRVYNNSKRSGPGLIASGAFDKKLRIFNAASWKAFSEGQT